MKQDTTYSIGAFAKLAGVTVRTLHFYDEVGLLKPVTRTESQHRLYQEADLLRLQQILTLRYIGFSLQEVQNLLGSPAYHLGESLRRQKEAIDHQILQLQGVSYALGQTLAAVEAGNAIDWLQVAAIIRDLSDAQRHEALRQYFPPEDWAWVHERAVQMPSELIQEGVKAWENLYAAFRAVQELPPEHPQVQALAAQMQHLINMFTGGKPAIEQALTNFYSQPHAPTYDVDPALREFMYQALLIYRATL